MAKNRAKTGRPTVITEDVLRKIEEVAALDGSVKEMAFYAGIHFDTLYAYLAQNKEFSERIDALRERPVLKARQTVVKSLDNPSDAHWYLERKRKNEFAQRVEQTGADGKNLILVVSGESAQRYNVEPNRIPKTGSN